MPSRAPTPTHAVLLGAGAAHAALLRARAGEPNERPRLTLVASAIAPGLTELAHAARVEAVAAEPVAIDLHDRKLRLRGGRVIGFDLLAIDGTDGLDRRLATLERRLPDGARVAVIASDPETVAFTLAASRRLGGRLRLVLIAGGAGPLPDAPTRAQAIMRAALVDAGVELVHGVVPGRLHGGRLPLSDGSYIEVDAELEARDPALDALLADAGMATDPRGAPLVRPSGRSVSHGFAFVARRGADLDAALRRAAAGRRVRAPRAPILWAAELDPGRALVWTSRFALAGRAVFRVRARLRRMRGDAAPGTS
jgi:hypothetical protein